MKNQSGIYIIQCMQTGKIYIGSSKCIRRRLDIHKVHLRKGDHPNPHLQSAWKLYENSFTFNTLELCEEDQLLIREKYWMDFYDSKNREKGYNILDPGQKPTQGRKADPSTKPKKDNKPRKLSSLATPILVIDISTGNIIDEYPSVEHCSRAIGLKAPRIRDIARNIKSSKKGKGVNKSWRGLSFSFRVPI